MRTISINESHCEDQSVNNTYIYKFPNSIDFKNGEAIAVSSISLFYSWYNISSALNNNKLSYTWTSGTTQTTHDVVIPDGIYEISSINAYLQFVMIANGHYLQNASGANTYYIQIVLNPTRYGVQINTFDVPTTLPVGFSNPTSLVLPTNSFAPVLTIPSQIHSILGFTAGFQTTTANSYLSSSAPQVNPNSNVLVSIDLINNPYSSPSSVAFSFPVSVAIGEQIFTQPTQLSFNRITPGSYNQLRLTFLNTQFQPIAIRDPQVSIILVIDDKSI